MSNNPREAAAHAEPGAEPDLTDQSPWVLFEPARARNAGEGFLARYAELLGESGIERLSGKGQEILIKIDVGEVGAFRGLRPAFVRTVVEQVHQLGRHAVLFDNCHVRQPAAGMGWSFFESATLNGLVSTALGGDVNVGDGWGGGETELLAIDGEELGGAEVSRVVVDGGGVIILTHVTGHPLTGLSGALLSLGEGCLGRRGKMRLAKGLFPEVGPACDGCGACVEICPQNALSLADGSAQLDQGACQGCSLICTPTCPIDVLNVATTDRERYTKRVVEAGSAVAMAAMGKLLFVNLLFDLTAEPEAAGYSDLPVVPDLGVLISTDPVALDTATLDLLDMAPGIPGTRAQSAGVLEPGAGKLQALCGADPRTLVAMADTFGLGSGDYRLISL
jgi:uncharacterized Fe-S center protein